MVTTLRRRASLVVTTAALGLSLVACGGDDDPVDAGAEPQTATGTASEDMTSSEASGGSAEDDEATAPELIGEACSQLPAEGDGSAESMAEQPVAAAAATNPLLTDLVDAIDEADLAETLDDLDEATVFGPTNDAFDAVPQEQLDALYDDTDRLTAVLTTHVVPEALTLEDLRSGGPFTTVEGGELTVEFPEGADLPVVRTPVASASVVCGNVQTGNAVVHVIDTVLTPQEAQSDAATSSEGEGEED